MDQTRVEKQTQGVWVADDRENAGNGLQELRNEKLEAQGEWRREGRAPVVKRGPCRTFRE
jgi:Neuraminidase (sialidase)